MSATPGPILPATTVADLRGRAEFPPPREVRALCDSHEALRALVDDKASELERVADTWAWLEAEGVSLMPVLGGSGAFVGWSCGHVRINRRIVRGTPWEAVLAARAALNGQA